MNQKVSGNKNFENGIDRRNFLKLAGMGLAASSGFCAGLIPRSALCAEELAKKQLLKLGTITGDIEFPMDPMFAWWEAPWLHFVYSGLVRMKVGDESLENLEPDLATDFTLSDDHTIYTFKLRKGVKFHRGYGECTAEDVLFTFDRLKNDQYSAGKGYYENIDKLEAPDDYTFKVHVKRIDYFFMRNLVAYISSYIVSKKAVKDLGDTFKSNPVGTGPFQFKEYRAKDRIIFKRHDEYFRGQPIIEQIDYIFMPDENSRLMAMETGAVDMVREFRSGDLVQRLRSKGVVLDGYKGSAGWVFFNLYDDLFKDKRVRQALFYATDRQAIADFYGECGTVMWGMIPPNIDGAKRYPDRYPYNPEKAKELLAEAGYPRGFSFSTDTSRETKRIPVMEMLQSQWKKVGVNMKLTVLEHAAFLNKVNKGAMPLMIFPATKPEMDSYMMSFFYGPSCYKEPTATMNVSCYGKAIPGVDNLIEKARVTFDREKRNAIYAEIQDQLMEDVPAIPVYDFKNFEARRPYVDIGYEFKMVYNYCYRITEKTRLLKH